MPTPSTDCPATVDDLFPPNLSYRYFSLAGQFPFNYPARDFQPVNAWWLAEASLLAYADPPDIVRHFREIGMAVIPSAEGRGTFCYLAGGQDFVIVAFRGTQILTRATFPTVEEVVRDWTPDGKIDLTAWPEGGAVHRGFRETLDTVWNGTNGLKSALDQAAGWPPRKAVWFTGHSLGAALATLAAQRYGRAAGVYTFGSPCVGDEAFAGAFKVPTHRLVNAADMVVQALVAAPYNPSRGRLGRYKHVGQLKYVQRSCPPLGQGILQRIFGGLGRVLDPLIDHAPIYYALYTRDEIGG